MVNLYAYTYPAAMKEYPGFALVKVGDSIREAVKRMKEQGQSAEWQGKLTVGIWNGVQNIARDYQVHAILKKKGWHYKKDGDGWEWFKIPVNSTRVNDMVAEAYSILDDIIASEEGKKVRNSVKLRVTQQNTLDQAMEIIASGNATATIIANLCPRFGKTIWALILFNLINKKYGNRVMLLPAYWLSVHSSFIDEIGLFDDFIDIALIDTSKDGAEFAAQEALSDGQRIIIPMSLHGNYDEWIVKHNWIADIDNDDIFMFADEGDFGTHAKNQVAKLNYILGE